MPRRVFEDGREIVFQDFNQITPAIQKELYDRVIWEVLQRRTDGFFEDSFFCEYVDANTVNVVAGTGFQLDETVDISEPKQRILHLAVDTGVELAAAHATLDRIDIVCAKHGLVTSDIGSRRFKDYDTGVISTTSQVTEEDWDAELLVVNGTADASPAVPATPAGYLKLAEVLVTAATGVVDQSAITDTRTKLPSAEGMARYTDYDILGSDPASPPQDTVRFFYRNGILYQKTEAGVVTAVNDTSGIRNVRRVTVADSPIVPLLSDSILLLEVVDGNIVVNLPPIISGKAYTFIVVPPIGAYSENTNTATINTSGGEFIQSITGGALGTSITLTDEGISETFVGQGSIWYREHSQALIRKTLTSPNISFSTTTVVTGALPANYSYYFITPPSSFASVTLPDAVLMAGRVITLIKDTTVYFTDVSVAGGNTLDGATTTTYLDTPREQLTLFASAGGDWITLDRRCSSEWVSFTPGSTGTWNTNVTYSGKWRRVGDSMEIQFLVTVTFGAPSSGSFSFKMPSGYTIDTDKLLAFDANATSGGAILPGNGFIRDASANSYLAVPYYSSSTAIAMRTVGTGATYAMIDVPISPTSPITFGTNDIIQAHVTVPILRWRA